MRHKAIAILNPISGTGKGAHIKDELSKCLRDGGYDADIHLTSSAGDARNISGQLGRDYRLVVVGGGDGTVNEVVNGLSVDVPVGLLPLGTENLLAGQCGVGNSLRKALDTLITGQPRRFDVGVANGRRFVVMTGIGLDADVVERAEQRRSGTITRFSYAMPILQSLRSYAFPEIRLTIDDHTETWAYFVMVANCPRYGGGLKLTPNASPEDGLLEVLLLRGRRLRDLASLAVRAFCGRTAGATGVEYVRCRKLEAHSEAPVPYQVDGDYGGLLPLTVEVKPQAITLLVRPDQN